MGSSRAVRSKLSRPVRRFSQPHNPVSGRKGTLLSLLRVECIPREVLPLADDFFVGDKLPEILESHLQLAILNRRFQRIHSPQRRPADACSVQGESSAMARANKLVLFLVPWHRATQVRTDGRKNTKLALTIFRHIDRLLGYRFAPPIHLLNLNSSQYWLGQGRELVKFSHRCLLKISGPPQQREKSETNERHRKQGSHK